MKKNGFTLIELLSSLIILGIVAAIGVQTYNRIIVNNDQSKYEYYVSLIEAAADLHFETKKPKMSDGGCLSVNYATLLNKGYLQEQDVTCTGKLLLRRSGNRYTYDYGLLSCQTKSGKAVKSTVTTNSTGCTASD